MKNLFLTLLIVLLSSKGLLDAQWTTTNPTTTTYKVGIGTTSNPSGQLDVWRPASNGIITRFGTLFDNGQAFDLKAIQTSMGHGYFSLDNSASSPNWQNIVIPSGSVGIGVTSPSGQLDIWRPASNGIITRFATLFDNGQAFDLKAIQTSTGKGYYSLDNSASSTGWQNIVIPSGSVGIGTTTPNRLLEVGSVGSSIPGLFQIVGNSGLGAANGNKFIYLANTSNSLKLDAYDYDTNTPLPITIGGNGGNIFLSGGSVGIGTTMPSGQLDIWRPATNGIISRFATLFDNGQAFDLKAIQTSTGKGYYSLDNSASSTGWQNLVIPVGNVGIGTAHPAYTLDVLGTIRAQDVKVDMNGVADYVFKPGYYLRSISEVDKYIKENNHLPDIKSAEEIEKDGASVSEMQNKLLQKVEELTLYAIEQNKEVQQQKTQLEKQNSKIESIEEQNKLLREEIELLKQNSKNSKP